MPSLEGPGVKNGGKSERLKGEKGEERGEGGRRMEKGVQDTIVINCQWPLESTVK